MEDDFFKKKKKKKKKKKHLFATNLHNIIFEVKHPYGRHNHMHDIILGQPNGTSLKANKPLEHVASSNSTRPRASLKTFCSTMESS
jgi:hypothetical protein